MPHYLHTHATVVLDQPDQQYIDQPYVEQPNVISIESDQISQTRLFAAFLGVQFRQCK